MIRQLEQMIVNKENDSATNPTECQHPIHMGQSIYFPQYYIEKPLLHDEVKILMDCKRLCVGNAVIFYVSS